MRTLAAGLTLLITTLANGQQGQVSIQDELALTHVADAPLCERIATLYSSFDSCRLNEEQCFVDQWAPPAESPIRKLRVDELAVNQYGYTKVSVSETRPGGYVLLYLNNFQGDRHPRLLETWKTDARLLERVTALSPQPLQYQAWVRGGHGIEKQTRAAEFASVLAASEKISDDASPIWSPAFTFDAKDYAITRQCEGQWEYGAYYHCSTIIKLTVNQISAEQTMLPVCEFNTSGRRVGALAIPGRTGIERQRFFQGLRPDDPNYREYFDLGLRSEDPLVREAAAGSLYGPLAEIAPILLRLIATDPAESVRLSAALNLSREFTSNGAEYERAAVLAFARDVPLLRTAIADPAGGRYVVEVLDTIWCDVTDDARAELTPFLASNLPYGSDTVSIDGLAKKLLERHANAPCESSGHVLQ